MVGGPENYVSSITVLHNTTYLQAAASQPDPNNGRLPQREITLVGSLPAFFQTHPHDKF